MKYVSPYTVDNVNETFHDLKKEISQSYFNTDFLEACRSCNGRDHNVPRVEAALQAKAPIKYETVS